MFRQFARAAFSRAQSLRGPRSRVSLARVFIGVSGTAYCLSTLRTIHSDVESPKPDVPKEPENTNPQRPEQPQDANPEDQSSTSSIVQELEKVRVWITVSDDDEFTENLLRENMFTYIPDDRGSGIARTDSVVVASNYPTEDFLSSAYCYLPSHSWTFFGVYDGHNGLATSSFLASNLLDALVGALADLFSKYAPIPSEHVELGAEDALATTSRPYPPPAEIDNTIKETFLRVDDEIVNWAVERAFAEKSKEAAINLLSTAQAGSCALVAFYESDTRVLRVALTGDSRAVLGRRTTDENGKDVYVVHVLSVDQNAKNPLEEARMSAEHPGEKIMDKGRVVGWGMARAFGDATFKWSREIQQRLHADFLGERIHPNCKTPPYFTAEPEVTTTEVQPGDFMVMASDGLWDCLTNEEVVGLVGVWLKKNAIDPYRRRKPQGNVEDKKPFWERDELPVNLKEDNTTMYRWWKATKRFINVDNNVAVHLVRNALGGADRDLTAALLKMNPPRSRRYRDDIGIQVVFFD